MLNLNQAIRTVIKLRLWLILFFFLFITNGQAFSQVTLPLPLEFQNLSINAKALEKDQNITVNSSTSTVAQNLTLDKTGFILHLVSSPKIKDDNIKIKIFSQSGEEVQTFKFIDDTIFALFALVDPLQTYSIIQEIKPSCESLTKALSLDQNSTICPDTEAFKIFDNIMLTSDTSFKIPIRFPVELYTTMFTVPENTNLQDESFKFVDIFKPNETNNGNSSQGENPDINIANLLSTGEYCLLGSSRFVKIGNISKCSFENKNVQTIITFKNDLINKIKSNNNLNIAFSLLPGIINGQVYEQLVNFSQNIKSSNKPTEINQASTNKFFLESYNYNSNINLGQLTTLKTRIKKNIFKLNNSIELNQALNKTTFNVPFNKLEGIINPFKDKSNDSVLTNISITGDETMTSNLFNISIDNNIVIKNLAEPEEKDNKTRFQTSEGVGMSENESGSENINENLKITTYIFPGTYDTNFSRTYSFAEETTAPSVDEKGKAITIINNKSRVDLEHVQNIKGIGLTSSPNDLTFNIEQTSKLLDTNTNFKNQLGLSGFLIPPDFRPVLEDGYRATIQLSMTIKLKEDNSVNIVYQDIKTKDEVKVTNFFSFLFLPIGEYKANIKFDEGNREKLFQKAGLVNLVKSKESQ